MRVRIIYDSLVSGTCPMYVSERRPLARIRKPVPKG
jgi:hypothetical protein